MAVAGCINAYDCSGNLIRTLEQLQSSNIGVGVQYTAPNPLDDKKINYIKYTDKCGCTCTLTGENEILIYATNGVIKNLSLTNDDANEKVIVKWNDVFGSNWLKTVVRYKTGSAPTSITDGTLAVEETTKNQYSSTGYGVSGLSDDTTYYFSVFGVDFDGTVINVQSGNITTSFFLGKYQRVQYIGRNGNNYIDTLRVPKQTTPFEVQIGLKIATSGYRYGVLSNYSSAGNHGEISFEINAGGVSNNSARFYVQNSNYGATQDIFSSGTVNTSSFSDVIFTNVGSGSSRISVNGTLTSGTISYTGTYQNYSAFLFIDRALRWSTFTQNSYVSYLKIYENGTLIKDFVPVYRKSDNVIGLVDKISKTFYTNSGSGAFSKGGNIPR